MPLTYEFKCRNGHEFERILPVAHFRQPQQCECGAEGRRILSLPTLMIKRDIAYQSPIDGRTINSEQARRDDLARNNCMEYDPGMKQDYQLRISRGEADLDKQVDSTIEAEISRMPIRKREKLEAELKDGANAEPVRLEVPNSGR
jgi:putative FmdB family regulatory protein